MPKQILPNELAEVVCGLLVRPSLIGELDTPQKHQAFMLDIGRVVADHCGGHINGLNGPDWEEGYLNDEPSSPMLSVSPNDSLPSLHNCIWSYFDPTGWENDENVGEATDVSDAISAESVCEIRSALQNLLFPRSTNHNILEMLAKHTRILNELLNHTALDFDTWASDCLTVFDEYEWEVGEGGDILRFELLKNKGLSGSMTKGELKEFLHMLSEHGETHLCYTILQGEEAIDHYNKCSTPGTNSVLPERYSVVTINTGHLTEADRDALDKAVDSGDQMILKRDAGFFVKLFEEESSNYRTKISETLAQIICWAHRSGYRMVEFDCDAPALAQFPVFEW